MSEFDRSQWSGAENLSEMRKVFNASVAHVEAQGYRYPTDGRLHVAQAMLSMGGLGTAVMNEGTAAGGKTFFGDLVVGADARVTIEPDDSQASLFGHRNPINNAETIEGRANIDPNDPRLVLNEVPQLKHKGPLHGIWDGNRVVVNGRVIPRENFTIYSSGNFSDGEQNHEANGAFKSRQGIWLLTGDADEATRLAVLGRDLGVDRNVSTKAHTNGVVPYPEDRARLRRMLGEAYPLADDFGSYVNDLLHVIEKMPELEVIDGNMSDGRLTEGWQQAVRGAQLARSSIKVELRNRGDKEEEGKEIDPWALAQTGALVLPTQVELSDYGRALLRKKLDMRSVEPLYEQIALRKAVAAAGFTLALLKWPRPLTNEEKTVHLSSAMERFTYANAPDQYATEYDRFTNELVESAIRSSKERLGSKKSEAVQALSDKGVGDEKKFSHNIFGLRRRK